MIQYACGQCGMLLQTELAMVGRQERCCGCGQVNTVPAPTPVAVDGSSLPPASPVLLGYAKAPVVYGGFWLRFVASILDGLVIGLLVLPINLLILAVFKGEDWPDNSVQILISWLYFAFMESSARQATLGKMALGLVVTDEQGERISFGRATGRHFGKVLSYLTLSIGFIMAGFTRRKQALHDKLAGCLVVKKQNW